VELDSASNIVQEISSAPMSQDWLERAARVLDPVKSAGNLMAGPTLAMAM